MKDILIIEWINLCEQIIQDHQGQHEWSEEHCICKIWCGIVLTKYLKLTLIKIVLK